MGFGVLAGGVVAVGAALLLPTTPARADGLPVWVRVAAVVLILVAAGVAVMPLWRTRPESAWTESHRWRTALGLGAAVLGTWAVLAGIADIRSGLPGPATPLLAVGCVALLVAAVVLVLVRKPPEKRGSVARQALPAAVALTVVAAIAGVAHLAAGWIPVDATTAERADPAAVPDSPGGQRWTSTWPTPLQLHSVVAAGAGAIVASDDRVVAIDGSTGAERWQYRRAGAWIDGLTATPDGRTVVANFHGGGKRSSSALFAFDANTGELRWSRQPGFGGRWATNHVLIRAADEKGTLVGVDIDSGEDRWTWTPPPDCEPNGPRERSPDAVLVPVICRAPAGDRSYALIGVEDRGGTERWRFTGRPVTRQYPDDAELSTSPDGRVVLYKSSREGREARSDPVLLESATGAVVYRTGGDPDIVGPDMRTPVVQRELPGADATLALRDLSTGIEHPLDSTCPALKRPRVPDKGGLVLPYVTERSVLVLCFVWHPDETRRVTVDVHSRSDASRTATITATDAFDAMTVGSKAFTDLIPAPGAVALVVESVPRGPTVVVGLA